MRQLLALAIATLIATLLAWPILIALRSGQINLHGWIIKRNRRPLVFWLIVAFNVLLAVVVMAIGFGMLPGRPS
jgi:hypothetical protein